MMILICIKQHLSKIWNSIYEKIKQHWGWVEKTSCLQKKRVFYRAKFKALKARSGDIICALQWSLWNVCIEAFIDSARVRGKRGQFKSVHLLFQDVIALLKYVQTWGHGSKIWLIWAPSQQNYVSHYVMITYFCVPICTVLLRSFLT